MKCYRSPGKCFLFLSPYLHRAKLCLQPLKQPQQHRNTLGQIFGDTTQLLTPPSPSTPLQPPNPFPQQRHRSLRATTSNTNSGASAAAPPGMNPFPAPPRSAGRGQLGCERRRHRSPRPRPRGHPRGSAGPRPGRAGSAVPAGPGAREGLREARRGRGGGGPGAGARGVRTVDGPQAAVVGVLHMAPRRHDESAERSAQPRPGAGNGGRAGGAGRGRRGQRDTPGHRGTHRHPLCPQSCQHLTPTPHTDPTRPPT